MGIWLFFDSMSTATRSLHLFSSSVFDTTRLALYAAHHYFIAFFLSPLSLASVFALSICRWHWEHPFSLRVSELVRALKIYGPVMCTSSVGRIVIRREMMVDGRCWMRANSRLEWVEGERTGGWGRGGEVYWGACTLVSIINSRSTYWVLCFWCKNMECNE